MTFTAEDQEWFVSTVKTIVKAEIGAVREEFSERIDRVERTLSQRMDRLDEKIEHVETALLTEFHKWAGPTASRINSNTAMLRTLDLSHEILTERVTKLEKSQSN